MKYNIEIIRPSKISVNFDSFICKISLKKTLDANNLNEFEYLLVTLIKGGMRKIILDIEELNYLDSSAIGKLISITKGVRKLKGDVVVTRYSAEILNLAKTIKLEKFMHFFPTIDDGINFLKLV